MPDDDINLPEHKHSVIAIEMEILRAAPWDKSPRPFVKWAGGKGQLLGNLEQYFPRSFEMYYEPFLGGGAVFFHMVGMRSRFSAILSDINEELITTYVVIKEQVEDLINRLKGHSKDYSVNPEKYYYEVRETEPSADIEKAARLIFLNKTCFNGLYRVNGKGKFNVPFGRYKNPKICDEGNLRSVSSALRWSKAKLLPGDYREATKEAKKGDFVYFDPPYHPLSSTASFTSYTRYGFSIEEQENLSEWFEELHKRGCRILLSNSNTPEILSLYDKKSFHLKVVPALRAINCKGNLRKGHTELIIRNY